MGGITGRAVLIERSFSAGAKISKRGKSHDG